MFAEIKENVTDWKDDQEITAYLEKILRKEAGDGSGLIYGMGHAIYTKSDPRAVILKQSARSLAEKTGYLEELNLLESIERLTPGVFARVTGWCAHRIEEVMTSNRIIRPAYKSLTQLRPYIPMENR
jgi:citrate synthase